MRGAIKGAGTDTVFAVAQINWLENFRAGLHKLQVVGSGGQRGMALIPNTCLHGTGRTWDDALLQRLRGAVDGVLDEAGWTGWGAGRVAEPEWSNVTMHALDLQAHGVAYYSINECGAVGTVANASLRQWIVGSYLMSKSGSAAVYMSGVSDYGRLMRADWPELLVSVGEPQGQ